MASWKDLPEMKLSLKDSQEDVYKLLEIIKPAWKRDQIKIKNLSGGYSCCMLRCSHSEGEAVTVRVRGYLDGVRDPQLELQVVKELSSKGVFTPLLAVFENGFCYEYIPGKPVVTEEATEVSIDEEKLRHIARQMANIHAVKVPELDYDKPAYFDFLIELLSTSNPCCEDCPSMEQLKDEVRLVEEVVSCVGSPLVLNHGDAHPGNFVWDDDQRQIAFVDYELSQVAPRAVDIAYLLDSYESVAFYCKIPSSPPTDLKGQFCLPYLQRWNELHNQEPPTDEDLEQLLLEIKYFKLVVKLAMVVYTVKFPAVCTGFDSIESIWQYNYGGYLSTKEEMTGINRLGKPDETDDKK